MTCKIAVSFGYKCIVLGYLIVLASSCAPRPEWKNFSGFEKDHFPDKHWTKAAIPEEVGWSSAHLARARELSKEIGSTAVMIVQHGVVVDAWGQITTKSNLHSCRKSLLSGLIGVAVDRKQIDLSSTMADLQIDDNEPRLTAEEKTATVGDLIKARSGIYHPALYETRRMTASKPARGSYSPGRFWHYNNWDFNALGTIYEQQTGRRIFEAFKEDFADPLHMEDYLITDGEYVRGSKSIHPAYPFRMTARDFARFALLYLRQGRWKDKQIVSSAWVTESTATHSNIQYTQRGYGYMWWTGKSDGLFPYIRVREHSYYASGYGGQYAIVFPYLDLVVVHRVNTDFKNMRFPSRLEIGQLLWLILSAAGVTDHGHNPGV